LTIASLLTRLTRKEVKFEWSNECEESFLELNKQLSSAPALALPRVRMDLWIIMMLPLKV